MHLNSPPGKLTSLPPTLGLIVALSVLLVAPPVVGAQQQSATGEDYLILLDVTKSMLDEPHPLWTPVLSAISAQIENFPDGIRLAIVPFAGGPMLEEIWPKDERRPIASPDDRIQMAVLDDATRNQAKANIATWQAKSPPGEATWICNSVNYALTQLQAQGSPRPKTVFMYTDGDDNSNDPAAPCGGKNFGVEFSKVFNTHVTPADDLQVKYIDLNTLLKRADKETIELNTRKRVQVLSGFPEIAALNINVNGDNLNDPGAVRISARVTNNLPGDKSLPVTATLDPPVPGVSLQPQRIDLVSKQTSVLNISAPRPLDESQTETRLKVQPETEDFIILGGEVPLTLAWRPVEVDLASTELDLGNLASAPSQIELRLKDPPPAGRRFTVRVAVDAGLQVDQSELQLSQDMALTIRGANLATGPRTAKLHLTPTDTTLKFRNGSDVSLNFAWRPTVEFQNPKLDDDNLAGHPKGVGLQLSTSDPLPVLPGPLVAHVEVIPADQGIRFEPADMPMMPQMRATLFSDKPLAPGPHRVTLHFTPKLGEYDPKDVDLAFTYDPHDAEVSVQVTRPDTDMGRVTAGTAETDVERIPLTLTFDKVAGNTDAGVEMKALLNGQERPDQLWFEAPGGQRLARMTVMPGQDTVTVDKRLDVVSESRFMPGSESRTAMIDVQPTNSAGTHLKLMNAAGTAIDTMAFKYAVDYPLTAAFVATMLGLLGLLAVAGYAAAHPRFPAGAVIEVDGGARVPLRAVAETGFKSRWFGASLTLGSEADSVDVGATETLARLKPTRGFGLFEKATFISPIAATDTYPAPIEIDGKPLTQGKLLTDGDRLITPVLAAEYKLDGSAANPYASDYSDPSYTDDSPYGSTSSSYPEDDSYGASPYSHDRQ